VVVVALAVVARYPAFWRYRAPATASGSGT
jgi:hypothetical protein